MDTPIRWQHWDKGRGLKDLLNIWFGWNLNAVFRCTDPMLLWHWPVLSSTSSRNHGPLVHQHAADHQHTQRTPRLKLQKRQFYMNQSRWSYNNGGQLLSWDVVHFELIYHVWHILNSYSFQLTVGSLDGFTVKRLNICTLDWTWNGWPEQDSQHKDAGVGFYLTPPFFAHLISLDVYLNGLPGA